MALKLIRCIGHDAEQKQEEAVQGQGLGFNNTSIVDWDIVAMSGDGRVCGEGGGSLFRAFGQGGDAGHRCRGTHAVDVGTKYSNASSQCLASVGPSGFTGRTEET